MGHFLGIDLGTQGCRALVADEEGSVISSSYRSLVDHVVDVGGAMSEQRVDSWWRSIRGAVRGVTGEVEDIDCACVDSTSGTVLAVDREGRPLTNAIMYNDGRAIEESEAVSEAARDLEDRLGYRIRPSFSVAKILWLKEKRKRVFESTHLFAHAADYIVGRLTETWGYTDHTNALKSGFDLLEYEWPDFYGDLGLPVGKMPAVMRPGEPIGQVSGDASSETGIPEGTPVVAGLTDGCASQIASGAASAGDWSSTLGTTLVLKGVTEGLIRDPKGRIYSHLHPEGLWMPGGASSTGGECLSMEFGDVDLRAMDARAENVTPTDLVIYPLVRKGERFPFADPGAEGFICGSPRDRVELYAGMLEGVAYLERLAYELMSGLGASVGQEIFTVGGGSKSRVWLQIRANVMGRTMTRSAVPEAAMGAAILAASSSVEVGLGEMARRMVTVDLRVKPDDGADEYRDRFSRFREEISRRGYLG